MFLFPNCTWSSVSKKKYIVLVVVFLQCNSIPSSTGSWKTRVIFNLPGERRGERERCNRERAGEHDYMQMVSQAYCVRSFPPSLPRCVCFGLHLINASQRMTSTPWCPPVAAAGGAEAGAAITGKWLLISALRAPLTTPSWVLSWALIAYSLDVQVQLQSQLQFHSIPIVLLKHCILSIAICLLLVPLFPPLQLQFRSLFAGNCCAQP